MRIFSQRWLWLPLLLLFLGLIVPSCGGGDAGTLITIAVLDELFGTERSSIFIENAVSSVSLKVGEEFQLRVIHRQLRDYPTGYGYSRYYYEEEVTDECDYSTDNPLVAGVTSSGRIIAIAPGNAKISVKFKGFLQKADFAYLDVVVTE